MAQRYCLMDDGCVVRLVDWWRAWAARHADPHRI